MLQSVKVKDYMSASLITFAPDLDVMQAVSGLIKNRIAGAPVVDRHGNLVGMLSERDCMRVALETTYYAGQVGVVEDYMAKDVVTIEAETSILDLAQAFVDKPYRRYPVVDNNRLVGQISIRDVMIALEKIGAPEFYNKA